MWFVFASEKGILLVGKEGGLIDTHLSEFGGGKFAGPFSLRRQAVAWIEIHGGIETTSGWVK